LYISRSGAYYDIRKRDTTLVSESMYEGMQREKPNWTRFYCIFLYLFIFFYSLFCATLHIL